MKNSLLILSILCAALPTLGQAKTIFSCTTEKGNYLSIEKMSKGVYEYRHGPKKKPTLVLKRKESQLGDMQSYNYRLNTYVKKVGFKNGDYRYWVVGYWDYKGKILNAYVDINKNGKDVNYVGCKLNTLYIDDEFNGISGNYNLDY